MKLNIELTHIELAILAQSVEEERTSDHRDTITEAIGESVLEDLADTLIAAMGGSGDITITSKPAPQSTGEQR